MSNTIGSVTPRVSLIASEHTWIEGNAIQQLEITAKLPDMVRVVGMPDLHPGRGYPVGAAFFSQHRFYPALIGNDIGCGMSLWQTDLLAMKQSLDKLEKNLGNIDGPLEEEELGDIPPALGDYSRALGTIGGGNHFAELLRIDEIYQPQAGLDKKRLMLLVHSGSRGLGQLILEQHVRAHGHHGLLENTDAANDYLQQHQQALDFAGLNRQLIAQRILQRLRTAGDCLLDIHHNLLAAATIEGVPGWLHRKGATPSDEGLVVIPGSRGDYSYIVQPLPTTSSLYSLAHGAGRKWMRSECKDRLSARFSTEQLARTRFGSRVICRDRQLIYQEAPEAYKPIDSVVGALQQAGLVTLVARMQPVLTYKISGGQS
ncbi:RNA ligase RtcB family protein [Serratia fonticola]|uniref:RNA ligase RtcB family protein n=1 Tax=Serratia fonticola TaxID=47917 RepID=UPI00192B405B|nr:RNA ligase RtcB family protein [Serratia fonticola]MBL5860379.1 RNA ligase RtcB family protein [Serratia fonticola]